MPAALLPCGLGEQLAAGRDAAPPPWTACAACAADEFGLWTDTRGSSSSSSTHIGSSTSIGSSSNGSSSGNVSGDGVVALIDGGAGAGAVAAAMLAALAGAAPCYNCPPNAVCPGGPLLLPRPGFWHSAANSSAMQRCPQPDACVGDGAAGGVGDPVSALLARLAAQAQQQQQGQQGQAPLAKKRALLQAASPSQAVAGAAATGAADSGCSSGGGSSSALPRQWQAPSLRQCQEAWYASNPPGAAVLAALAAYQADMRLQLIQPAAGASGNGSSGSSSSSTGCLPASNATAIGAAATAAAGELAGEGGLELLRPCVLWGLADTHPLSYMAAQCAEGYAGNLCAACRPGYFIDAEFECQRE